MTDWLRVFDHEITRRRRIATENLDLYKKLRAANPKGLLHEKKCSCHIWVPATHLMIHDNGAKSHNIGGMRRRAFNEAAPYKSNGVQMIPQMCWLCDATREHAFEVLTAAERKEAYKAQRPKPKKGRSTDDITSVFGDLFG